MTQPANVMSLDDRWEPMSVKSEMKRLLSPLLPQVWSMDGYYKGRRVLEYRTMGDFTKGQNFVQHLLPHPWAGTGHVVYNGSLYYNKHQSNILVRD